MSQEATSAPAPPVRPDSLRAVLGTAVLLALALLAVAAVKSHRDLAAARSREAALQATIAETTARIARRHSRIGRLRDDPATLERMAREDLGLVRPADVVIVLPPEETRPVAVPAAAVRTTKRPAGP